MLVYFFFKVWDPAVAYFDGVTIEQFEKLMTRRKVFSYKIPKIISTFCFKIRTKWRVQKNNFSFSILFVVVDIFVCRVILQSLPTAGIFLELFGVLLLIH